jgi:phosphate transport system permease protein
VTALDDLLTSAPPPGQPEEDSPRVLGNKRDPADWVFRITARTIGLSVLAVTGGIALFLGYQLKPTLAHYGWSFFTENRWQPEQNIIGIKSALLGTIEVAIIALIISVPLALLTALYITEYSPLRIRAWLVAVIDLMAAVPSIVYGLWGFFLIMPHAIYVSRFLNQYFGWMPWFHVDLRGSSPSSPAFEGTHYLGSAFIAAIVVSMMVIPMACAVMRAVFDQTPKGEREAAFALGATKWGMIRAVVLPFGRSGIIGGSMLGLGRALGETIAVLLIISLDFTVKVRPLEAGSNTISYTIANFFGEATSVQLSALLAAGFVLFMMTLLVNTIAAWIVTRSRSGAMTEI